MKHLRFVALLALVLSGLGILTLACGEIEMPPPQANFSASRTEGDAPLLVFFTAHVKNVDAVYWDFNGDGYCDDVEEDLWTRSGRDDGWSVSTTYMYEFPGTYTVILVVVGWDDTITIVREGYIHVTKWNPFLHVTEP